LRPCWAERRFGGWGKTTDPDAEGALVLAQRYLAADRRASKADQPSFDHVGTLLLALTLAAYALAMTIGRGRFGLVNMALLVAAALGVRLFVLAEA
jgi:hypothetical protein